jgi:hypothetical protein
MLLLPLTLGLVAIYGLRLGCTSRPFELSNFLVQVRKPTTSTEDTPRVH